MFVIAVKNLGSVHVFVYMLFFILWILFIFHKAFYLACMLFLPITFLQANCELTQKFVLLLLLGK